MKKNLFKSLYTRVESKEIDENIYEVLDWLLNDNKYDNVEKLSDKLTKFIKRVKKIEKFINKDNYVYGAIKNIDFDKKVSGNSIFFSNGNGESRDLIRHMRNSIAHNNAKISNKKSVYYIEMIDYKKDRVTKTAYMKIEIEKFIKIYNIFKELVK